MAPALVHEVEKLADEFAAAFLFIERHRLEHRPVVFHEAVAPRHFAPSREDVVPLRAVGGIKVAEAGQGGHVTMTNDEFRTTKQ